MSTINATNIKNAASSVTNIILDTNGGVTCGSDYDISNVEGKGINLQLGNTSASLNIQTPQSASNSSQAFRVYRGTEITASILNNGSITASTIESGPLFVNRGDVDKTPIIQATAAGNVVFGNDGNTVLISDGKVTATGTITTAGDINLDGNLYSGGEPASGQADGSRLMPQGVVFASRTSDGPCFIAFKTGDSTPKAQIDNDGSITAAGQLRVMKRSDFGDELYGTHAVVAYNTSGSLSTMVSINYQGGNARVFEGRNASTTATSYIQADGNASFVSTFAVNSYVKLDDGSNLDLKKVGLALVALKATAAASNDYASLKSAIATALADL